MQYLTLISRAPCSYLSDCWVPIAQCKCALSFLLCMHHLNSAAHKCRPRTDPCLSAWVMTYCSKWCKFCEIPYKSSPIYLPDNQHLNKCIAPPPCAATHENNNVNIICRLYKIIDLDGNHPEEYSEWDGILIISFKSCRYPQMYTFRVIVGTFTQRRTFKECCL